MSLVLGASEENGDVRLPCWSASDSVSFEAGFRWLGSSGCKLQKSHSYFHLSCCGYGVPFLDPACCVIEP